MRSTVRASCEFSHPHSAPPSLSLPLVLPLTCVFILLSFYAARTPAAFLAGAVAGALPALASRNPRTILFSAMGSAGLMGMMESVEGIFGGAGKGGGGLGDGGGD